MVSSLGPRVAVVITAAGSGTRLGYGAPKALVPLRMDGVLADESSLFAVALRNASLAQGVRSIVVTAPAEYIEAFSQTALGLDLPVPVAVVEGSVTRQSSVFAGLRELKAQGFGSAVDHDAVVLVHDAARAMATPAMIDRVVSAVAAGSSAVIPSLPVADTLKLVDPDAQPDASGRQRIVGSADRSAMRIVQTPQGFPWEVLWAAHNRFAEQGQRDATAATDDSTIAQWAGHEVDSVEGDVLALKVTTSTDLALARVLYSQLGNDAHIASASIDQIDGPHAENLHSDSSRTDSSRTENTRIESAQENLS